MEKRRRIVVVGGSAAGPKAAAKARRIDNDAEVIILQKDADLSMASCGYPYYVGGFFDDRNMLICTPTGVIRNPQFYFNAKAIDARVNTEVTAIDRAGRTVSFRNTVTGETGELPYDKLIMATGSVPKMPPIPGVNLEGITTLQSMKDADFLRKVRDEGKIKKAVVIGGGLIGIETCEALQLAGIEITVVELLPQLLTFLDWELAKLVENHVRSQGANVITDNGIAAFLGENGKLTGVKLQNGTELSCELAVVAIGVRPNVKLAQESRPEDRGDGWNRGRCLHADHGPRHLCRRGLRGDAPPDYRQKGPGAVRRSGEPPGARGGGERRIRELRDVSRNDPDGDLQGLRLCGRFDRPLRSRMPSGWDTTISSPSSTPAPTSPVSWRGSSW